MAKANYLQGSCTVLGGARKKCDMIMSENASWRQQVVADISTRDMETPRGGTVVVADISTEISPLAKGQLTILVFNNNYNKKIKK